MKISILIDKVQCARHLANFNLGIEVVASASSDETSIDTTINHTKLVTTLVNDLLFLKSIPAFMIWYNKI
ncbi:MAG: hypothetical protein HY606_07925 [Planctomycetes bacterium]|nr:hypothetical protein [Planctomycetota bacterium]